MLLSSCIYGETFWSDIIDNKEEKITISDIEEYLISRKSSIIDIPHIEYLDDFWI
jgi:hypothetical protein